MYNNYSVFISLLTGLSSEKIIRGLLNAGCSIGPLDSKSYVMETKNSAAATLSMHVSNKRFDFVQLRDFIIKYLNENKVSYYSVIVIDGQPPITWGGTNIFFDKLLKPKPKPVSYLKLVKEPNKLSLEQQDENDRN